MKRAVFLILLLSLSPAVPGISPSEILVALWPAMCALAVIISTKSAVLGLGSGVISGSLIIHHENLILAPRAIFADFVFPALNGPWHVGAIIFTLVLGAFAGLLEKSGGFDTILNQLIAKAKNPQKRLLGSVYFLGLICFFDGLANALLIGRIARPLADRTGISRERLAWVVDSTSSPVACIAFISTWIATQLSLIEQGLATAPFPIEPYSLFFQSIPGNPYCLLTLLLVPMAILLNYQPKAMRRYPAHSISDAPSEPSEPSQQTAAHRAILPLIALSLGIFFAFPLLSNPVTNLLSLEGWKTSFSGDAGPYALVTGSLFGLAFAWLLYPKARQTPARLAAFDGATKLLPALIVLILAWSLGNVFSAMGAGEQLAQLLSNKLQVEWLPLAVFGTGAFVALATGSSWGTMGLLMPLVLPAALSAAELANLSPDSMLPIMTAVIGAVFGGAVFGDHCSPFSDTTIVSSVASGCQPTAHVHSQLPFAAIAASFAAAAYALMAFGLLSWLATLLSAILMTAVVWVISKPKT